MWQRFIHDYLNFSKKERTGILVLLSLILFFIILPFTYPFFIKQRSFDHGAFEKEIAALQLKEKDSTEKFTEKNADENKYQYASVPVKKIGYNNQAKGELFYFDPNTISGEDWERLGIRDKTIQTIQKYISKGGKFYKPEDIGKIWGLQEDEVQRLIPYVHIQNRVSPNFPVKLPAQNKLYEKRIYAPITIDVNTADTTAFIALPGIGSKLANRICIFRDKLGGFYAVAQIGEVFGLRDSVFQLIRSKLTISNTTVKQININTATLDEMKAHPYLRYAIANAIVQYRAQHGNYTAVEDIKKITLVTADIFNKAFPYLKVN